MLKPNLTNDDPFFAPRRPEGEGGGEPPADDKKPLVEAKEPSEGDDKTKSDWRDKRIAKQTATINALKAALNAKETETAAKAGAAAAPAKADGETKDEATIRREVAAQMAAEARQKEFNDECNKVYAKGTEEYPEDWKETITAYANHTDNLGNLETNYGYLTAVLETTNPTKVLRDLGKNPDKLAEILEMKPFRMAIELEKIATAKAPRETSRVDPPPPKVGGKGNTAGGGKGDMKAYADKREAELIARAEKGDPKAKRLLGIHA